MTNTITGYQHPKHDIIAGLILAGATDTSVAADLKVGRRAVARTRSLIGAPAVAGPSNLMDKILPRLITLPDGHTGWKGSGNTEGGAPIIRHRGKQIPVAHAMFELRTGRKPIGFCRADCEVKHCLTKEHVVDDIERRTLRLQMRALLGEAPPWTECTLGHLWDADGRVEPNLRLYCRACGTGRTNRNRALKGSR
jgi:hypothetical protein